MFESLQHKVDIVQLVDRLFVAQYVPCSNQGIHPYLSILLASGFAYYCVASQMPAKQADYYVALTSYFIVALTSSLLVT